MTTSAYNFGNMGLASKVLRTRDLIWSATEVGCSVLGMEADLVWLADIGSIARPGWSLGSGAIPNVDCGDFSVKVVRHNGGDYFGVGCGKRMAKFLRGNSKEEGTAWATDFFTQAT